MSYLSVFPNELFEAILCYLDGLDLLLTCHLVSRRFSQLVSEQSTVFWQKRCADIGFQGEVSSSESYYCEYIRKLYGQRLEQAESANLLLNASQC